MLGLTIKQRTMTVGLQGVAYRHLATAKALDIHGESARASRASGIGQSTFGWKLEKTEQ